MQVKMENYVLNFNTEYYQFYLLDSKTKAKTDADDFWNPEADKRRLAIGEGLLGITISTYGDVVMDLRLLLSKPKPIVDATHVVEASIKMPSGILQIKNCTAYETKFELPIEKGTYRVRVTTQKIIHSSFVDGKTVEEFVDNYIVEMWKNRFAKPQILKAITN
jgi:hypothetical protein